MAPKMKASKQTNPGEQYPPELVKKYGLLRNGKLNVGVAALAEFLERKAAEKEKK